MERPPYRAPANQRARALRRIDHRRRMLQSLHRRPRLSRSRLRASRQCRQCPEAPAWPPTAAPTRGKQHGSELDAPYPLVAGHKCAPCRCAVACARVTSGLRVALSATLPRSPLPHKHSAHPERSRARCAAAAQRRTSATLQCARSRPSPSPAAARSVSRSLSESKHKHGSSVLRSTGGLQHAQSGAREGRAHPSTVPLRAQLVPHVCALLGLCSCGAVCVPREWQMCCSEPPFSECVHCFACSSRSTIHASYWIGCHGIAHALAVLELRRCDRCGLRARMSCKCQKATCICKDIQSDLARERARGGQLRLGEGDHGNCEASRARSHLNGGRIRPPRRVARRGPKSPRGGKIFTPVGGSV
jgi:hypothetical protein